MKNIKELTHKEAEKELDKIRNKYDDFIKQCSQEDFAYADSLVRHLKSYTYKENKAIAYSKFTDYKNKMQEAINSSGDEGEVGVATSGSKEHTLTRLKLNLPTKHNNKNKKG